MKKILLFCLMMIGALFISGSLFAEEGLSYTEISEEMNKKVYTGVTWNTYIGKTTTDAGTEGNQVMNTVTVDKSLAPNVELVHWTYNEGTTWKKATLNSLANDYEEKNPGYHILAGVNGDFFNMTDPIYPFGDQVSNGNVYGQHYTWLQNFMSLGVDYYGDPLISDLGYASFNPSYTLYVYDQSGAYIVDSFKVSGVNAAPSGIGTALYMYNYQQVIPATEGVSYYTIGSATATSDNFIKYPSGESQYNFMYGQGKVTSTIPGNNLLANQFTIATSDPKLKALLGKGIFVKVQHDLTGTYENALSLGGAGGVSMKNGTILSFDNIKAASFKNERHPRTAIAFKNDGSMMMAAIDGRDAANGRDGMNLREVAKSLEHYGAETVVCFDGGGSTTLIIPNSNGGWLTTNQCSDGTQRQVADAWFFVVPDIAAIPQIENLENAKINLSISPILSSSAISVSEAYVVINGEKTHISLEEQSLELQLMDNKKNFIYFTYDYFNSDTKKFGTMTSHIIVKDFGSLSEKVITPPRNFRLIATEQASAITLTLEYDGTIDPTVVRLYQEDKKIDVFSKNNVVIYKSKLTEGTLYFYTLNYDFTDENKQVHTKIIYPKTFVLYYSQGNVSILPDCYSVSTSLLGSQAIQSLSN